MKQKTIRAVLLGLFAAAALTFAGCTAPAPAPNPASAASAAVTPESAVSESVPADPSGEIPAYSGEPYTAINGNVPDFSESDLSSAKAFESYSPLDSLGRCGPAFACVGPETMPTEERGDISDIQPSGWHSVSYDGVEGGYLYNRCHLIGYQLTAENDNAENLITGTRYLNIEGMLPFENLVADYIHETGGHVLYRVTPVFAGGNLVASGVRMEAESVEDRGESVLFHVFCYNVQPGIQIDYATGDSAEIGAPASSAAGSEADENETTYILNTNSKKFHRPSCSQVGRIQEKNKETYTGTRAELLAQGYTPCGTCDP